MGGGGAGDGGLLVEMAVYSAAWREHGELKHGSRSKRGPGRHMGGGDGWCWWVGGVGSVVSSMERTWRVETGEEQEGSW